MSGDPRVLAPLQQAYLAADDGSNARTYIRYSWRAATNQHGLPWHQVDAEIRAWTPTPAEPSLDERLDIYGRDITELAATANDHTLELAEMKASLEQRVAELTDELSGMAGVLESHRGKIGAIETMTAKLREQEFELRVRITNIEHPKPEQHPEPTAPDDPVCQCGHEKSFHKISGTRPCMYSPDSLSPYCECESFLPAPQPAPDLDPERVEVTQENVAKALEIVGRAFHHPDTFFQYEDDRASFQFAVWVLDRIGAKFSYLKDGGA